MTLSLEHWQIFLIFLQQTPVPCKTILSVVVVVVAVVANTGENRR